MPGGTANERNEQPYDKVTTSLDNQNYVVTTGASCPVINGLQTKLHQDCRSADLPKRLNECPVS